MMKTIEEQDFLLEDLDESKQNKNTWMVLWLREWSTYNWLMSSFISTIIVSEVYAIILSVTPNLFVSLWLSWGITSLLLSSLLTGFLIVSLGLLTGALFYSAHLAYNSMKTIENSYQPLIEVWSKNTKLYNLILENLLDDDTFLKITQALKDFGPAKPLHDFLSQEENVESVRKILSLLKKIWAAETADASIKTLALTLLSDYVQEENAKDNISRIWALWEILQNQEGPQLDLIIKIIKNSSLIAPYFEQLQAFSSQPEVVQMLVDKPELLPYLNAINTTFKADAASVKAANIKSLYQVFQSPSPGLSSVELTPNKTIEIHPEMLAVIKSIHAQEPQAFVCIWDKIIHHRHLAWAENLVLKIHQGPYQDLIQNPLKLLCMLSIFADINLKTDAELEAFHTRLAFLSDDESYEQIIETLHLLDSLKFIHIHSIEKMLLKADISANLTLLKLYMQHILDETIDEAQVQIDLEKLLINNETLHLHLNTIADKKMTSEENLVLVIKNYLYPELIQALEQGEKPAKKFNPIRKLQKILHMLPEQRPERKPDAVAIANLSSTPMTPLRVETKEQDFDDVRSAYQHWKKDKQNTLFRSAESKANENAPSLSPGV
ncbi:MAG TPA: hypothetical protein DCZ80_05090 [Legionellales bacterium]|nr:hypothetical protein [Legionellales bacterium]